MTIYVIDKTTNELVGVYDNALTYDIEAKTITISAGRGVTTIQLGEDQAMAVEGADTESPAEVEPEFRAYLAGLKEGFEGA